MSNWFSMRRYILLQLLRGCAFFLLAYQYQRYIPELLGTVPLSVTVVLGMGTGWLVSRLKIPRAAVVPTLLLAPWAGRLLVDGALNALALVAAEPFEHLPLLFDITFWPALPVFYPVFIFTFLVERHEPVVVWEIGARAILLVTLFWNQGMYDISLYPHPIWAALVVGGFVLVETVLLLVHTRRTIRASTSVATAISPRNGLRRLMRESIGAVPLLILAVLLFGAFYRTYSERATQARGGLLQPSLFSFDFSDYLELESEIRMSDDLVLLFYRGGRPQRHLLRRSVLDAYSPRRGFYRDEEALDAFASEGDRRIELPEQPAELAHEEYYGRETVSQEVYTLNFNPDALFALSEPVHVTPYENWDESSFSRVYEVESSISTAFPTQLARMERPDTRDVPEGFMAHYTEYGNDGAVRELAEEVTDGEQHVYDKVAAIEEYFHNNFYYSLSPGVAADGNQLHHFLFDAQKGYCTYFAYGMALMARSLNIPARVALGFIVDPAYEVLNFYTVRADTAHAWVEVYFPEYGWIEFDPTSETLHPDEEFERAPPPDREEIAGLLEEILAHRDELTERSGDRVARTDRRDPDDLTTAFLRHTASVIRYWYVILPLLYMLAVAAVRIAPLLVYGLGGDARIRMAGLYRNAVVTCAAHGLRRARGESRSGFARRCAASGFDIRDLTGEYLRSVFSPDYDERALAEGVAAWKRYRASSLPARSIRVWVLDALDPRVFLGRG